MTFSKFRVILADLMKVELLQNTKVKSRLYFCHMYVYLYGFRVQCCTMYTDKYPCPQNTTVL